LILPLPIIKRIHAAFKLTLAGRSYFAEELLNSHSDFVFKRMQSVLAGVKDFGALNQSFLNASGIFLDSLVNTPRIFLLKAY